MLFKSPLRKRIEAKITDLYTQVADLDDEKEVYKEYKRAQDLCRCITKQKAIEEDINLLRSILYP